MKAVVVVASGRTTPRASCPREVAVISEAIKAARHHGHRRHQGAGEARLQEEAENLLNLVKLRLSGDYLQTSALVRNGRS